MRDRVTFCMKTIHRPHCCATLVRSIYEHCGDERPLIYVLDDGKHALRFSQVCPDEAAMASAVPHGGWQAGAVRQRPESRLENLPPAHLHPAL